MLDPNRGKWSNYAAGTAEDQFIAQKQVQWVLSNSPKTGHKRGCESDQNDQTLNA
jgi:hypothetical protein